MARRPGSGEAPRARADGPHAHGGEPAAGKPPRHALADGKPALWLGPAASRMPEAAREGRGFRLPPDPRARRQGGKGTSATSRQAMATWGFPARSRASIRVRRASGRGSSCSRPTSCPPIRARARSGATWSTRTCSTRADAAWRARSTASSRSETRAPRRRAGASARLQLRP